MSFFLFHKSFQIYSYMALPSTKLDFLFCSYLIWQLYKRHFYLCFLHPTLISDVFVLQCLCSHQLIAQPLAVLEYGHLSLLLHQHFWQEFRDLCDTRGWFGGWFCFFKVLLLGIYRSKEQIRRRIDTHSRSKMALFTCISLSNLQFGFPEELLSVSWEKLMCWHKLHDTLFCK